MSKKITKLKTIVVVSGGWDPLHVGHVRLFQEAKKLGDELIVIVNNDNWLRRKKGYVFMPQEERMEVIKAIRGVDDVIFTEHPGNPEDMSVSHDLRKLRPDIFANGGDRFEDNTPETAVCKKIGCQMEFNIGHGGKVQSSSWLLSKYANVANKSGDSI